MTPTKQEEELYNIVDELKKSLTALGRALVLTH